MNERVLGEVNLRTQLSYLAFKRVVVVFEMLGFLLLLWMMMNVYMDPFLRLLLCGVCALRIVTELLNLQALTNRAGIGVEDRWTLMWPVH